MKTTIDKALTKVFQLPMRRVENAVADSSAGPESGNHPEDPPRKLELYIDPPHSVPRPSRPEAIDASMPDAACVAQPPALPPASELPEATVVSSTWSDTDAAFPWFEPVTCQAPASDALTPIERSDGDTPSSVPQPVPNRPEPVAIPMVESPAADPLPSDSTESLGAPSTGESPATTAGSARPAPFRAAWEVDSLGLPPVCRDIVDKVSADLYSICQQLTPVAEANRNLLSIDSCARGEGRTTVALALAYGFAQIGQRILLVDADFGHPNLAAQLGLAVSQGWEHAVHDELPVHECCIQSIGDGFSILPLGRAGLEVHDLQTLQRIQAILVELSDHFDGVLLDHGPGGHAWVSIPREKLLGHVVVRSLRQTSFGPFQELLDRIRRRQTETVRISVVDNFATPSASALARSA